MKYSVDIKSLIIGFFTASLLFVAFSFKQDSSETVGRYQSVMGAKGMIILDTKTGDYIINAEASDYKSRKGNFGHTHELAEAQKDKNL